MSTQHNPSRPNFVFIMTDTQGANVLGCYTGREYGTEGIDRIADEGLLFERAYTTCPLCSPARGGIFTGLMPSVNGAHTNNLAPGLNIRHMGQYFRAAGYRTAYAGKWHLDGLDYFDSGRCPDGWEEDFWYDGRRYLAELSDDEIAEWRSGSRDKPAEFTWAHRISNRALDFLGNTGPEPFLLVLSYDEPHGPFVCPPEYYARFAEFEHPVGPQARDSLDGKPEHQREWSATRKPLDGETLRNKHYFGCNAFVADEIGRVVDAVRRLHGDNTWIVFTSDHGDMLRAHGLHGKGACAYEEITRIPLLVSGPGCPAGGALKTPVSHLDLLPTMLELAGAAIPPILQGRSLARTLLTGGEPEPRPVPIEFMRYSINHDGYGGFQPIRAVVRGPHKLVINLLHTDELYDLAADPHELRNLIEEPAWAEVRNGLHDALLDEMDRIRDPFRGTCWERRPWRAKPVRGWDGAYRNRPDDGYWPTALEYSTARPEGSAAPTARG